MRIGFAIYGNLDMVSGGFAYDRALIDSLVGLGHEVHVLSLPWVGYGRALGRALCWGPRAAGGVGLPPCDVIIEDELIHPSLVRGAAFWRRPGRPTPPRISLIHNLKSCDPRAPRAWLAAQVERRYLRGIDGAIAGCSDSLAAARALAGRPFPALVARPGRDHAPTAGNAVPTLAFDREAAAGRPLRVLHVAAAVVEAKGLHRLVHSLAAAKGEYQIDVVGDTMPDPAYVAAIAARAAASAPALRLRWHGRLRGEALWALYRSNQIFALPSDREAYSLACLEALGFGLPVIATNRGGLVEMFASHPDAGVLLDPDDTNRWATVLGRLDGDRARLAAMSAAARLCHAGHRTWRQVALNVQTFLAERAARSQ